MRYALLGALVALGACGDDLEDDGPCRDPEPGTACTWLGQRTADPAAPGGYRGVEGFTPDGAHRLKARVSTSMDMLFHSSGEVWFHDWNNHLVRRVRRDDTVETVVGWNDPIFPGDGVPGNLAAEHTDEGAPGTEVQLNHPTDFAEDESGDVLLMAWHNHKLRRIDPDTGYVRIECGAGAGYAGDGGPAELAVFKQPNKLARGTDGTLYITDQQNQRVRRIDPAGIITTVAGSGTAGFSGDGGQAIEAQIACEVGSNPEPTCGVAVDGDRLYISDTLNHRIRVVDLETGIIDTLAGTGEPGFAGDGGPATAALLDAPMDLEIGPDGDLYFTDTYASVVRAIHLESGEIRTVVGTGELGLNEEGLPARQTMLRRPWGIEFDPDGNLYVLDSLNHRIVKVTK
jgi:serine/threonine-protein kinase